MNVIFLGATKGMGQALARLMAQRGDRLFLLGRSEQGLERSASDLRVRSEGSVLGHARCDLEEPDSFSAALEQAFGACSKIDAVVVTAGIFATQEELENDSALTARLLAIDFSNTVLFCEEARKRLLAQGGGKLCVFSSVAGERGRKPVVIYGSTKAGLTHYLEGLDHRYRSDGLEVITVKPGFVKTNMTAELKPPPFAGEPDEVAERVLKAIDRGSPEVYAPFAWGPIMGVIRRLPRFIMRRVGF